MIATPQEVTLPAWVKLHPKIQDFEKGINHCNCVLMEDYLIAFMDNIENENLSSSWGSKQSTYIFAIDLRDNSVQEAQLEHNRFKFYENSSFHRYKENMIINFGGTANKKEIEAIDRITVECFKPFQVTYKRIILKDSDPTFQTSEITTGIYQDSLYVYGPHLEKKSSSENKLWRFHLEKLSWLQCTTTGKDPGFRPNSTAFFHNDNLILHPSGHIKKSEFFVLNLRSMEWNKFEQKKTLLEYLPKKFNGDTFQNDFLVFGNIFRPSSNKEEPTLFCWNNTTNFLSAFPTQKIGFSSKIFNTIVYRNLLLVCGKDKGQLSIALLNLNDIQFSSPSPDGEHFETLFLNEENSDIIFKVQDRMIPAHKKVLIQKSRYFANLFNSGMIESRQDVIEIPELDSAPFQEFLRWIYCGTIQAQENSVIKLLPLADKYLQNDLKEKCRNFLILNIYFDNVYKIMDVALEQSDFDLWDLGSKFLIKNIECCNLFELIKYIDRPHDVELTNAILKLKDKTITASISRYVKIYQEDKANLHLIESFLIRNIQISTVLEFDQFLRGISYLDLIPKGRQNQKQFVLEKKAKETFESIIAEIKKAFFNFIQENIDEIYEMNIYKDLPPILWLDLVRYMNKTTIKKIDEKEKVELKQNEELKTTMEEEVPGESEGENCSKTNPTKSSSQKRKEPVQDEKSEGKPQLKKTKKTALLGKN